MQPVSASDVTDVASSLPDEAVTRYEPFRFTGTGGEYFRIWIVNVMLSVVTLGIYSAWAKVRRLQYFYRHTRISGASFDYHGKPLALLKGRILASCLFGGYYAASAISPAAGVVAFAMLAALLPWLLARSLRFRLYNSSYRGLRFHFHGSTAEAYRVFLAMPALAIVSLFTLVPFAHHRLKRFQHANAAYGQTRFTFDAPVGAFYKSYLIIGGCLCLYILAGVLILLRVFAASDPVGEEQFDLSGESLFVGLNITSIAVKQPVENLLLSNSLRAGLTGFARTLANEVAADGITVNNVLPGYTRTERLDELAEMMAEKQGISPSEFRGKWEQEIPMRRLGEPREFAAAVAFLASERASYITGTSIQVDGGWIKSLL